MNGIPRMMVYKPRTNQMVMMMMKTEGGRVDLTEVEWRRAHCVGEHKQDREEGGVPHDGGCSYKD